MGAGGPEPRGASMSTWGLVIAGAVAVLLVVGIVLEGRRQARIYGRGSGRSAMAAGMLDLQRHLEPERRVEALLEAREEVVADDAGEGATPSDDASVPVEGRRAPAANSPARMASRMPSAS